MFNEINSVENFVRDMLCGKQPRESRFAEQSVEYKTTTYPQKVEFKWGYTPAKNLHRSTTDVLIEEDLRAALVRLNPEIAASPDRADEVLYKLRAILLSVQHQGLVHANEEFTAWMRAERSMPFGKNNQHTTIRLIDFNNWKNNKYLLTQQLVYKIGSVEKRFDLVLFINGMPLVIGEAKTATRPAETWFDGAYQIHNIYEEDVPAMFVPNVFSFATEGKTYRYGAVRQPLEKWSPWRDESINPVSGLQEVETAIRSMLRPSIILDVLENFSLFATDKQHHKIKIIARFQQYFTTNQIIERVVQGRIKKGLIWHFQGSGKSLLMVFAALKLRHNPILKNPTVIIVVDRIDLDTQITGTFTATDVPNLMSVESRSELEKLLSQDMRKVLITTIHKFGESEGLLNDRENIIVMVDEAHRTQEGDLGRKMRSALPNAFLFGLTGTPINKRDRNTFFAFGAEEDDKGYMNRYSFKESIRDNATLPLHFEARLIELRVDKEAINEAYANITGHLSEEDQSNLAKMAGKMSVLVKAESRVGAIVNDMVGHFQTRIEPNGFKAMVVTFDREACVLYKNAMDQIFPPESSAVVMTVNSGEREYQSYNRNRDEEEALLDRFRDPLDPLQILIVTSKLLTGFDAPILQVMYLDKPMKEHNLLQAICRTNRPFPEKTHGLIVDYVGVFDDVAQSLNFDEKSVQRVITNLNNLREQFPKALEECLSFFEGVDRQISGWEGLIAAQECLPNNETRDAFAASFSKLNQIWEALSPDPMLTEFEADYRWLGQVYESIKPPSGHGRLLWHALGSKTIELIHKNIHVKDVRDDLETLVMDADVLEELIASGDIKRTKEIEIQVIARINRHPNDPRFIELGKRLEDIKNRMEQGLIKSVDYLKRLLDIARELLKTEKEVDPVEEQHNAISALTELFYETRSDATPKIVEQVVTDIDEIVRVVRFPGWQQTHAGEREVKQALRKTLLKYQLHHDQELFDKAYEYIKEYY